MAKFLIANQQSLKKQLRGSKKQMYQRIDIPAVLDLVGESITNFLSDAATRKHADVGLEDLAGDISSLSLPRWIGQLSRLKRLSLWDGSILNREVALALNATCFEFEDLTFFMCNPHGRDASDIDHDLAEFFGTLRSDTLRAFSALSSRLVGAETLLALNNHSKSLRSLKLVELESDAIRKLSYLQGCKAIEVLDIKDAHGSVNLEATENDIFLEVISWLCGCSKLQDVRFTNLLSAPAILEHLCCKY
jgi:Leucine-rich repeat (LRR) protein